MYRTVPYIVLFLILALLQIFLFDNLSISIYLCPLVYIGFIVLLPIDARRLQCFFWLCRCPLRWIGRWGQRGSIRSLRFRSLCCAGRFCSLSAVRRDSGGWYSFFDPVGAGRISALPGSDGRGTPLPVFHVGVPVLGAVVPYARPTGREQCCYGGLHLAACAAVHH